MKKTFLYVVVFVALVGLVSFSGCKSADAASYTLTVTVGDGVSGTPVTGSTSYGENDTVTYSYAAQSGYGNLNVTLDGAPVANSGTVTMTANHTLSATADVDIRGNWSGRWTHPGMGIDVAFQATFSGNIQSGDIDGHIEWIGLGAGTERGTFTVTGNTIEFDMNYFYGTLYFEGTIENAGHMSGTWSATGSSANVGGWNLDRQI